MPYPSTKTTFTDPAGTTRVDTGVDHAQLHTDINNTLESVEDTLGTTAGTNISMNFAAGQFPLRITGGGAVGTHVTTLVGGTLDHTALIGTAQLTGGTIASFAMIGTSQMTGGTITSAVVNNPTIGTPSVTAGTLTSARFSSGTFGTPTVEGTLQLKDVGIITQTGTADNITLTPGAGKLVKLASMFIYK